MFVADSSVAAKRISSLFEEIVDDSKHLKFCLEPLHIFYYGK